MCEESIPGLRVDHVDISGLPLLNTDLETADGGFPPAVEAFRDKVRQADCFLFGSPEYNYSIASTCLLLPPYVICCQISRPNSRLLAYFPHELPWIKG